MFGIKKASRQEKEEKQKKENVNWSKVQAAKKRQRRESEEYEEPVMEEVQPKSTVIFGDEESLSTDAISLEDALYQESLLEIYDHICESGIECTSYLELVDSINKRIKAGEIVDSKIGSRVTPNTLLTELYRVCCLILDEEVSSKDELLAKTQEACKVQVEEIKEQLEIIKENEETEEALSILEHELEESKANLDKATNDLIESNNKLEELKEKYASVVSKNDEFETKVLDYETKIAELEKSKEEDTDITALRQEIKKLKETNFNLSEEVVSLNTTRVAQTNIYEELKNENQELKEKLEKAEKDKVEFNDEETESRIKSLMSAISNKDLELMDANNKIIALNYELARKKKELLMIPDSQDLVKGLKDSIRRVNEENKNLVDETITLMSRCRKLEDDLESVKVEKDSLEVIVSGYKKRLNDPSEIMRDFTEEVLKYNEEEKKHQEEPVVVEEPVKEEPIVKEEPVVETPVSTEPTYTKEDMIKMFLSGMGYRAILPKLREECRETLVNAEKVLEHIDELDSVTEYHPKLIELFVDCLDNNENSLG